MSRANEDARNALNQAQTRVANRKKKAQKGVPTGIYEGVPTGIYNVVIGEDEYRLLVSSDAVLDILSHGASDRLIFSNLEADYPDRYDDIFDSLDVSSVTPVSLEDLQTMLDVVGVDYQIPETEEPEEEYTYP